MPVLQSMAASVRPRNQSAARAAASELARPERTAGAIDDHLLESSSLTSVRSSADFGMPPKISRPSSPRLKTNRFRILRPAIGSDLGPDGPAGRTEDAAGQGGGVPAQRARRQPPEGRIAARRRGMPSIHLRVAHRLLVHLALCHSTPERDRKVHRWIDRGRPHQPRGLDGSLENPASHRNRVRRRSPVGAAPSCETMRSLRARCLACGTGRRHCLPHLTAGTVADAARSNRSTK